jgi:hypothetical protein
MIKRQIQDTNDEQLSLVIDNGDFQALKAITKKFAFVNEEAVLRYALAVLTKSSKDTLYVDDGTGKKVALEPSDSLKTGTNDGESETE